MVTQVIMDRIADFTGDAEWLPAGGADTESETFLVGSHVVKIRHTGAFQSRLTGHILSDVHSALHGTGLAPELVTLIWLDGMLVTVHERVSSEYVPDPGEIGDALARAHRRLAERPPCWTYPWVGFYGEHPEFAAITPAIEDDDLRAAAAALLPHARRPPPAGPVQYVHRDVHMSNVLGTADGACLIDWELAHTGLALDDAAMALCCLAAGWDAGTRADAGREFLAGYRAHADDSRISLADPAFRAAIALSGLRQGVAAWFDDEGSCVHPYWPAVRLRMQVAGDLLSQ
jgi:Phosphotransferase enzyme family